MQRTFSTAGFHSLCLAFMLLACIQGFAQSILYQSPQYTLYSDRVVQARYEAKADAALNIVSDYQSTASEVFSRDVSFKFSINEKDNEMPFGQNHHIIIADGEHQSGVIKFGAQYASIPATAPQYLAPNYHYTFRLDAKEVLRQFASQGFYVAADGSRIAKTDFKGFYIAGSSEPLSWDFVNLEEKKLMLQDADGDGVYEITLIFNPVAAQKEAQRTWKPLRNLSGKPTYSSGQPIVDALFRLATDEALIAIEPDSTFRTGSKWAGVWTRDVSYSILLAMACQQPDVAKISLMKKVKRGRIVQDTGSGGAWPVSSDRAVWAIAAWEIYKVTGDAGWLKQCYPIIKNTLDDDYKTLYDTATGLYRGESSFLDWREQTYPRWMDNAEIFMSECLGTNAVHYRANIIASEMAMLLGEDGATYLKTAENIKQGINKWLWDKEKGYYGQYLYSGNSPLLSSRYEALGEALAVLFDIANPKRAKEVISKSPLTPFGATCIFPQIPNIPSYHNNAVWPFVQSYWNLAAAKAGNETVLNHGLASIYRPAALFLTNYENFVASNGDYVGTEVNSDRMLWSMSGNLAMVYRVFMGIEFEKEGIRFSPAVPKGYDGDKKLSNFKYRNAILDITVKGYGNRIASCTIDGKESVPFIEGTLSGRHAIVITLNNRQFKGSINLVKNNFSPETPQVHYENTLTWKEVEGARRYGIFRNGKLVRYQRDTFYTPREKEIGMYHVVAFDSDNNAGFASRPVMRYGVFLREAEAGLQWEALPYGNFSGDGYIMLGKPSGPQRFSIDFVAVEGDYLIDFRYANGNGPRNTSDKCGIRSLYANSSYAGAVVFPQRGEGEWSDWGFTNTVRVHLNDGSNKLELRFYEWNTNMNGMVNDAAIDYIRVTKL